MASPPPLMSSAPPPIHHLLCHNSLRTLIIILCHHSFISTSSFISADQYFYVLYPFDLVSLYSTDDALHSSFPCHSFVITLYLYSMLHLFPRSAPLLLCSAIPLWPLLCHSATQVLD